MDAKKYINERMNREKRIDTTITFLDTKTFNSLYNWLRLYLIRLELEKDWWDKYWNGKMMWRDIERIYWDKAKEAVKIIDEEYEHIFKSKNTLAIFLVENDIPMLFVPYVWKVALKEIEKLIKDVYEI